MKFKKIYFYNQKFFDLNFSFQSSGLAIIQKNNEQLIYNKKLCLEKTQLKFNKKIYVIF